jgi:hypothetical protein
MDEGKVNSVPQGRIIKENPEETVGLGPNGNAGKQGGSIMTAGFNEEETRTPELHGSLQYQKTTADPGVEPPFIRYTDLTAPKV